MNVIDVLIASQRSALAAVGGRVDSPSKRKKLKAAKMLKKRGAYPPSAARIVRRIHRTQDSLPEHQHHYRFDKLLHMIQPLATDKKHD